MYSPGIAGLDYGWIKSISGTMFSGKTTDLTNTIDKLLRMEKVRANASKREGTEYEKLSFGIFKHSIDKRYSTVDIVSHSGIRIAAKPVSSVESLISEVNHNDYRVIAIDEAQFFDEKDSNGDFLITHAIKLFADEKRYVILAGLDKDFRGLPFGPMGDILAVSDEKSFHVATCAKCGASATLPQRLVEGKPAYYDDPVVMPGASEAYEPRCRTCHTVLMRKGSTVN